MSNLREGNAVLEERPLTAIGRPVPSPGRFLQKPVARVPGMQSQPERQVGLLTSRLGIETTGE
eukprot:1726779-Alexandrium_andersonii.AAC.3